MGCSSSKTTTTWTSSSSKAEPTRLIHKPSHQHGNEDHEDEHQHEGNNEQSANEMTSTVAVIDDDNEVVADTEYSYAEFPTHVTLLEANKRYADKRKGVPRNQDGTVRPFPSYRHKRDLFAPEKFVDLDKYADKTPHTLLRRPLEEIVAYLNKACTSDLQTVRAYFRWLCTRDIENLIAPDSSQDHENAVLKKFYKMKENSSEGRTYTELFADMCRVGEIQYHLVQGKVRTKVKLGMDIEGSSHENSWFAVLVQDEWRFIDVHFAALQATGGGPGEWELIDDNGRGRREIKTAPKGIKYTLNEEYFLMNAEEFIHNHRPFIDDWQLLARPVAITEFQDMAMLSPEFFEQGFSIGDQPKHSLQASDGEVEINIKLSPRGRSRFIYQLWRSTKNGTMQLFEGYELSQFVLLEQKGGLLCCRVVFPVDGDYKLSLFARTKTDEASDDETLSLICTYIMQCKEAKTEWNALPKNSRNEWGYSREMEDLGLVPITHPNATIETDDGYLKIKFKCTKEPVDCLVELRGLDETSDNLAQHIFFRQNELHELVIYLKLPARGLYALELYGKWLGAEGLFDHIATYLIASTAAAHDLQPYPELHNKMAGQLSENKKMKLTPVSHKKSVITILEPTELQMTFDTPLPIAVAHHMYFWVDGTSEEMSEYVFVETRENEIRFLLRFILSGVYTLKIFAKPRQTDGLYPHVYTYVIFVRQCNPECVPFPKAYNRWGDGCEVEGLENGHLKAESENEMKLKIPNAHDVAVITEGNHWIHLEKDEDEKWHGNVNVGGGGRMSVCAQYAEDETFNYLLECQVKPAEKLEEEKQARIEKEKEVREAYQRKQKEKEKRTKEREQEFKDIKSDLLSAIKERDIDKLRRAIAKVERNNYTKRLEKVYEEAKLLKKSLEKIARLRKLVLTMDQRMMSVIRSYANPPPIVHATMRATLLLLGDSLKKTKNWKKCQGLSNTIELNKRVREFDIRKVPVEHAVNSRKILDPIRLEDVQATSEGAATFYIWTLGMTEEVMSLHK